MIGFYNGTSYFQALSYLKEIIDAQSVDDLAKYIDIWNLWRCAMKKSTNYILVSTLDFIGGLCFFLAAIIQEQTVSKYGFFFTSACLLISGTGFLYTYIKNKSKIDMSKE